MIPQQLEDSLNILQGCIDCEMLMYYEIETYNQLHGTFYDAQILIDDYEQKYGIKSFTEKQYREAYGVVFVGDEKSTDNTLRVTKHL